MWKYINHPRPFTCPLLLISLIWIFNMWREKGLILINIFAYKHQRRIANYDASSVIFKCCDHQSHCKLQFFLKIYCMWYDIDTCLLGVKSYFESLYVRLSTNCNESLICMANSLKFVQHFPTLLQIWNCNYVIWGRGKYNTAVVPVLCLVFRKMVDISLYRNEYLCIRSMNKQ